VKKKPRRRHKKGKGSPGSLGPNKKSCGNGSAASRTEITHSRHISSSVSLITFSSFETEYVL
jgi:hypothetical protein